MKRLSFVIALAATLAVGAAGVSAQERRDRGDWGGRGADRREQIQPMPPRYEGGSGRYRDALRSQPPRAPMQGGPIQGGPMVRGQMQRGPRNWGRGDRLPPGYGAMVPNPGQYRLRQPPPGYSWVRNGRDLYLMQNGTGLVLDAIPGGF